MYAVDERTVASSTGLANKRVVLPFILVSDTKGALLSSIAMLNIRSLFADGHWEWLAVTPSPRRLRSWSIVNKCGVANTHPHPKLQAPHSLPITPLSLIPNGEQ